MHCIDNTHTYTHTHTYVCMYDMLALQLPLTIIKFETIICLLTRGEEKNPKSKNGTKKPKDPVQFFYKI